MASLTWWTWVLASSGCWWWTGKPGMLQSMALQRVGHDRATELNWPSIPAPPTSFVFSWKWFLRWWFGPFLGVTQFPWVSPMYKGDIHVTKLLFVFLLLICLFITRISQPPRRRIWKKKLSFLSYITRADFWDLVLGKSLIWKDSFGTAQKWARMHCLGYICTFLCHFVRSASSSGFTFLL